MNGPLGLNVQEVAVINAVIPILFIFTPPLAGFLAQKVGNFRVLLSVLTALGGAFALLLLVIPPARNTQPYPQDLQWGISCGRPNNRARYQKLMLHGFRRDECILKNEPYLNFDNVTFTPGEEIQIIHRLFLVITIYCRASLTNHYPRR